MNPEIACHLCHSQTNRRRIISQTFQTKCKLMPHLICHDLIFGILQYIANFLALLPVADFLQIQPIITDFPGTAAKRSQIRLQLAKQRTLATATLTAQHIKGTLLHIQ